MRNNLLAQGWKPELILDAISEDTGKSGTKRADERKGLQRLIELIKTGGIGSVAAFNVSRIYRVLSKAEYGAFCDLVLNHDIPVVTARRVYWANKDDNKTFAADFQAAAEYIEDHIKGVVIAAKNYRIENDVSYGGHSIPFGYVVLGMGNDASERKSYTIYEPHATLIRWVFRRFKELGGSLPALARELDRMDFRFPAFAPGITPRVSLRADQDGSYPLRNRNALISILSNKSYIGFYEYGGMLVSRKAHDAIVPLTDFVYAYEAITGRTLEGEEIQERKPRERRYGGKNALLDGVLHSDGLPVYVVEDRYIARSECNGFPKSELVVKVAELDTAFSRAMIAALKALETAHKQGLQETLYEQVTALQQQQEHATGYKQSLARIDLEISNAEMARRVSKEEGDEQGYRENTRQLVQLNRDRLAIEAKQQQANSEASDLEECYNLLEWALRDWNGMDIDKRKWLVRLLGVDANLTEISPHFVRLDVHLVSPINRSLTLFLHRSNGSRQFWTGEEDSILARLFPTASKQAVMEALPTHSWTAICNRGYERLGIRHTACSSDTLTHADMLVMREYGIELSMVTGQDEYIIAARFHNEA